MLVDFLAIFLKIVKNEIRELATNVTTAYVS